MLIKGRNIDLRTVTAKDTDFILELRLDYTLCRHISRVDADRQKQYNWLVDYQERENNKQEYYFIILSKNTIPLGTVRIYDFIGQSFCWGSWVLHKDSPSFAAVESALLVYEFAFYSLGFQKSHFDVRKTNEKVVAFHLRFGAEIVDEDDLNYYFSFDKNAYEKIRSRYGKFLPITPLESSPDLGTKNEY